MVANPPYMIDPAARLYRHGGATGIELSLRLLEATLARLAPGGRLVLYTGTPVERGRDLFEDAARAMLAGHGVGFRYQTIDPDVWGDELATPAYAGFDRIAAVGLVVAI